jgi:hypothetical protein
MFGPGRDMEMEAMRRELEDMEMELDAHKTRREEERYRRHQERAKAEEEAAARKKEARRQEDARVQERVRSELKKQRKAERQAARSRNTSMDDARKPQLGVDAKIREALEHIKTAANGMGSSVPTRETLKSMETERLMGRLVELLEESRKVNDGSMGGRFDSGAVREWLDEQMLARSRVPQASSPTPSQSKALVHVPTRVLDELLRKMDNIELALSDMTSLRSYEEEQYDENGELKADEPRDIRGHITQLPHSISEPDHDLRGTRDRLSGPILVSDRVRSEDGSIGRGKRQAAARQRQKSGMDKETPVEIHPLKYQPSTTRTRDGRRGSTRTARQPYIEALDEDEEYEPETTRAGNRREREPVPANKGTSQAPRANARAQESYGRYTANPGRRRKSKGEVEREEEFVYSDEFSSDDDKEYVMGRSPQTYAHQGFKQREKSWTMPPAVPDAPSADLGMDV